MPQDIEIICICLIRGLFTGVYTKH